MSTGSILSILAYPQYGYHLVRHTGLSLVHCSYLSVGSLQVGYGRKGKTTSGGTVLVLFAEPFVLYELPIENLFSEDRKNSSRVNR